MIMDTRTQRTDFTPEIKILACLLRLDVHFAASDACSVVDGPRYSGMITLTMQTVRWSTSACDPI